MWPFWAVSTLISSSPLLSLFTHTAFTLSLLFNSHWISLGRSTGSLCSLQRVQKHCRHTLTGVSAHILSCLRSISVPASLSYVLQNSIIKNFNRAIAFKYEPPLGVRVLSPCKEGICLGAMPPVQIISIISSSLWMYRLKNKQKFASDPNNKGFQRFSKRLRLLPKQTAPT